MKIGENDDIELGNIVIDITSKATGVLVSKCQHLDGHEEYGIQRVVTNGELMPVFWVSKSYVRVAMDKEKYELQKINVLGEEK